VRITLGDAVSVGAPLAVGGIGGVATVSSLQGWYRTLRKPDWNPPDAVFGPVWTTLYFLMGIALALSRRAADEEGRRRVEAVFGLQLALNLAWSFAFFSARSPAAGAVVILVLWASIVATIVEFGRVSRLASLLLLPYLAWVTFATVLNLEIWRLNSR
jgi:tryptophan-rich sensory protein